MIDLSSCEQQRPEQYRIEKQQDQDPIQAFRAAMAEHGLDPGEVDISGDLIRFDVDKSGDKAGYYVFFAGDISGGCFGNWKTGLKQNWNNKEPWQMTDAESAEHKAMVAEARRKRKEQEAALQEEARAKAVDIWERAMPASSDHEYLVKKGVPGHGLKESRGDLVIPVMDHTGVIHSLQFIKPDGGKKFLFGGRIDGCSFTIPGNEKLIICEGYATAASIHAATGATVICAFNAGNLPKVAKIVREKCRTSDILICADNDRFTAGNPGVVAAEKAAREISAQIAAPDFKGLPGADDPEAKLTDFNDLAQAGSLDLVKCQIEAPGQRARLPPLRAEGSRVKRRLKARPRPLEFVLRYQDQGLVPKGVVGVLTATGGTGKTFFLLSLARAAAAGSCFGPIFASRPFNTLVIVAEDTQDELDRRLWDICKGVFPDLLYAASVYGEIGPLMRLESGTPVLADAYYWLEETIKLHPGLELLILDPKSRMYGLDENNNDHATQWIQSLEGLSKRYGLTILFSHHTSKQAGGRISQDMGRGASGIVDGCRWQAGLIRMDEKTAEFYGIENPRDYILFDVPKQNYGADLPKVVCFRRGENGVLVYDEPGQTHMQKMGEALYEMIKADPKGYSKRDLIKEKAGADIAREMKQTFPAFVRSKDMARVLNWLIKGDFLAEKTATAGTGTKEVLIIK